MYVNQRAGLGLVPAAATTVLSVSQVLSKLGLGSSDPVKDQERLNRIARAYDAAMAGDTSKLSFLGGRSGEEYLQLVATDKNAAGSTVAYRAAQLKWGELQARRAAGVIGSGLIGQSDIPTSAVGAASRTLSNPWVLAALAGGVYLLIRRRR